MLRRGLIPNCGDTDSSAAPSALEHGAYIPLDHRIFLQWNVPVGRTQHESGSASFGITHTFIPRGRKYEVDPSGHDRAIEIDAVAPVHAGLPIERKMRHDLL